MKRSTIKRLAAFAVAVVSAAAIAGNMANPDAIELTPLPKPLEFKSDMDTPVPFDATTTVTVECPDKEAAGWLSRNFAEWYGDSAPKVATGATGLAAEGDEGYAANVDASGVKIKANTIAGVRWASYTLRQLAIAKRGTMKMAGRMLPTLAVADRPHLSFRAVHLCWFPETRPQQIERAIRLAALFKFNYAIVEPWGMYKSEKHPWWHWPNPTMTKEEVRRLAAIGRDLGITLIPQINCFGHASSSRVCAVKHAMLDLQPEYEPLYEPGGWNWCLSNPETQRVLRELIAEMHEDFGNPPFFHLGCDEAQPPSCPECRKAPYGELVCRHIAGLAEFVKSRGARAMIWHDMLLKRGDPRWKGFIAFGSKTTATLPDTLPKDVVICDWQYGDKTKGKDGKDWPTMTYFAEKGFSVAGCPWTNYKAMMPMANHLVKINGFGLIETTWHHLRGKEWEQMFMSAAHAAWGSPVSHGVSFERSLRMIGNDMKVKDYLDTGHLNNQVPPRWWGN